MQIVIDIPEYIYKICQGHGDPVYRYIAKGTPLPKGHGKLKDVDKFLEKVKKDREHEIYMHSWTADDVIKYLSSDSYAQIIIEADKS